MSSKLRPTEIKIQSIQEFQVLNLRHEESELLQQPMWVCAYEYIRLLYKVCA